MDRVMRWLGAVMGDLAEGSRERAERLERARESEEPLSRRELFAGGFKEAGRVAADVLSPLEELLPDASGKGGIAALLAERERQLDAAAAQEAWRDEVAPGAAPQEGGAPGALRRPQAESRGLARSAGVPPRQADG